MVMRGLTKPTENVNAYVPCQTNMRVSQHFQPSHLESMIYYSRNIFILVSFDSLVSEQEAALTC